MLSPDELSAILDSLKSPILFADTQHVTRYMNAAAIAHYEGGASLIGRSLLECHNEASQQAMRRILGAMQQDGLHEECITDEPGQKIYMRAVRDGAGGVLGYYERYQPEPGETPSSQAASA
jgi:DUF438 domain-containing protein